MADGAMRVLVVGGGAREHALVRTIARSPLVAEVFGLPGNAGIAAEARCLPGQSDDVAAIVEAARGASIDLVVVGPEAPLVAGLVDALAAVGIAAFGPNRAAARLEGSKAFCKEAMRRYGVPTSDFAVFDDADAAEAHLRKVGRPLVVKADGLAAGKGVVVPSTVDEACEAIDAMMRQRQFGEAGARVVVEERVVGVEVSFHAICDGERFVALAAAQDHKRAYDDDAGPNTGGMGAYSPPEFVTPALHARIVDEVIAPMVRGMAADGVPFRGVLFAGLMIGAVRAHAASADDRSISVLEFNVRFGDPETAVLMARLDDDLVPYLVASARGDLGAMAGKAPRVSTDPAIAVVLAARGYPQSPVTGDVIGGLDDASTVESTTVLHAGTVERQNVIRSSGGRVLCVTARGTDIAVAADRAYTAIEKIRLDGSHYRRDIAATARRGTLRRS